MIGSETGSNKLASLVRTCRLLERTCRSRPGAKQSDTLYYRLLATYFGRLASAHKEGKTIGLHTVFLPSELLYAMDIVPMHGENTTWTTAILTGNTAGLLAAASGLMMPPEVCSAHRGLAGAFVSGLVPRPDFVLWSNLMCDNTAKSGELLMELNHCPGFFLDHPFQHGGDEIVYLEQELRDLVTFLEAQTGRRMDWNKLNDIVGRTDQQIRLSREISELRKNVPSPLASQRFLELLTTHYLMPGQPESIAYLEALRDEMQEMVRQHRSPVRAERFRIMSLWVPPMHALGLLAKVADEFGAVSVVEPLFDLWREGGLDPDRPIESLARKSYMFPEMCAFGPLDDRLLKGITESAREFKVDGAIFYAHIGCRGAAATLKPIKDALNQIDLPMLTLDCDILDATVASEDEMKVKMEQFFELLQERK